MKKTLFLTLPFLVASAGLYGSTYYVSTSGSDSWPGSSAQPFLTINRGVSAAAPGDTILVASGTYTPANQSAGCSSGTGYLVTINKAGTAGAPITLKSQTKYGAVLDSQLTCHSGVVFLSGASYFVVQDFTIANGHECGLLSNSGASNLTIKGNHIYNVGQFANNSAYGTDGIYVDAAGHDITIDGNLLHNIGRTGGTYVGTNDHAIYIHSTNSLIKNNVIYQPISGWGIQTADGFAGTITNNTFDGPNPWGNPGHIVLWGASTSTIIRNNIFNNPVSAAIYTYQWSGTTPSTCTIGENVIRGVGSVATSDLSSVCTVMSTNRLNTDPMFVNPANHDYHLQSGSPAIDSAVKMTNVLTDFDSVARPQGAASDIGGFEYATASPIIPPVISAISVSGIATTSATIAWTTDQPADSYVEYGTTSAYGSGSPYSATMTTVHSVVLANLSPSTTYHYRIDSRNSTGSLATSSDSTFTTAAAPLTQSTFALSASSSALSVAPGQSTNDNITAALATGNPVTVSFSASGVPAGVTAAFSSPSCTATCSTTLTLSAASSAPAGAYSIGITATGSGTSSSTTVAFTVTGSSTADITTGLAAQWKFTDGSGYTALDSSGYGNNAALSSPTWWTSDYGVTDWFSGPGSYGSVNESASLEMTSQLTVSFWLRPSANANTDPRVISKLYDWEVKLNGAYPQFGAGAQYATLNYAIPLTTWHHIVFTFSTGVVNGYVDGVQVPLLANTFTGTETLLQYMYGLYLANDASLANSYIGSLDDVRIYNRALSATDVSALHAALKPVVVVVPPTSGGGRKKH